MIIRNGSTVGGGIQMPSLSKYASKAENYARYRWEYAPEAAVKIIQISGVNKDSIIADIGAGTGKFSRHFIGRVKCVYAIEPDPDMRRQAALTFQNCPDCIVLDGSAENIPLTRNSVNLITVAQAIHWFEPQAALREFKRVLKPRGWLAAIRNYGTKTELNQSIEQLFSNWQSNNNIYIYDFTFSEAAKYYFSVGTTQRFVYPFSFRQNWMMFLGALKATPNMPDECTVDFPAFSSAVKKIFEQFSADGWMTVDGETEILIGQLNGL
jgi:ubiquinone/menaquinone biosynthesis C-methylase UbiE